MSQHVVVLIVSGWIHFDEWFHLTNFYLVVFFRLPIRTNRGARILSLVLFLKKT